MRMVIKIAGALLERDEDVQTLARQITELARAGHELLVIHGGGRIFTATLARMGIESHFINGLRVTDRETRDAAVMVFAGLLNKKLAGAISLAGHPAVASAPPMPPVSSPSPCRWKTAKAASDSSATSPK
jgi:acetylglutamate kinase